MFSTSDVVLLFLLIVGGCSKKCNANDYCDKTLCSGGQKHIGCNHNNKFASTCDSPSLVDFGTELQNLVLNVHNEYRNKLASGATQFASAVRMPPLKWNEELAKLAEYNVKQCAMKHDQCRNTKSFQFAGQNLGYTATTASLNPSIIQTYIKQIQDNWYSESSSTKQAWLDKYPRNTNGKVIGHFTAMVQDRTTDIGCACATYTMESGFKKFNAVLLACDYSYTNMLDYPVYTKGSPAKNCNTGTDTTHTSLCSLSEVISPKPF